MSNHRSLVWFADPFVSLDRQTQITIQQQFPNLQPYWEQHFLLVGVFHA
jgi:hypothetical protein